LGLWCGPEVRGFLFHRTRGGRRPSILFPVQIRVILLLLLLLLLLLMSLLAELLVVVRPRIAAIEFSAVVLMIATVVVIVVVLLAALLLTALLVVTAAIVVAVTVRLHAVRGSRLSHSCGLLSSVASGGPLAPLVRVRGGVVVVVVPVFVTLPVEL